MALASPALDLEALFGREAHCTSCGKVAPSTDRDHLAFFRYRGAGSAAADESCGVCGFNIRAHDPEFCAKNVDPRTVIEKGKCTGFVPHGPWDFDLYYCGCRGWD